jgi:hypothetical protein
MTMVKLDGWCLPNADTPSLPSEASHFFLNSHYIVSARPMVFGELAGYLLIDDVEMAYFIAVSEAEMSMLFQMAR